MYSWIRRNLNGSLVAAVAAVALAACGTENGTAPDQSSANAEAATMAQSNSFGGPVDLGTCDSLAAPTGNHLVAKFYAKGYQIYRWDGSTWAFVEPSAKLYLGKFAIVQVGAHYVGPTWESLSGSKVVGSVSKRCPSTSGSIPWLLLSAASTEGYGIFRGVTFIQRFNTTGGTAPSQPGTQVGQMANVPYTADYAFYRGN